MTMNTAHILTVATLTILTLAGCSESSDPTKQAGDATTTSTDRPNWLLTAQPQTPQDIKAVKATALEGDTVTLRGIIGGRLEPLATDAAVFVMMDVNLHNRCVAADDDHCPTPWDYCCATSEDITANSATVQIIDSDGAPVEANLRDFGIEPLDTVTVVGTVQPRSSTEVLVIKATSIYSAD